MDSEFSFELQVCQWAEHHWPPGATRERPVVVARQLGTRGRRWDTVVLECDPEGLAARARFGQRRLDSDLLHVVRNAPEAWAWYRDALPDPGYPWRYVREAVHRAADRGVVETRTAGNRIELRRKWPYPDWVERIVAIENKPDLDKSAARALTPQVERDVALALADEVWVATEATGGPVTPALFEGIPVEAGILAVDPGERGAEAVAATWQPRTLAVDDPGTRIVERPSGSGRDASAARFEYADPAWKADKRLEIAERAYERGWRAYLDSMRPDCRHFELQPAASVARPYCAAKECHQTQTECAGSCADFEPEPPAWRQRGWPIDGGPGSGIKELLADQRQRHRPRADEK
ncbi:MULTISPECIES: DUF5787 family protein [Salinibaculum]|uniref:DUF5787 family protein n=1 Tax=Salinibaculum TaxID=2732368 RepID=UPI0030D04E10